MSKFLNFKILKSAWHYAFNSDESGLSSNVSAKLAQGTVDYDNRQKLSNPDYWISYDHSLGKFSVVEEVKK